MMDWTMKRRKAALHSSCMDVTNFTWPPLRGGSREAGEGEKCVRARSFGHRQTSLPLPLRGTPLTEGGF